MELWQIPLIIGVGAFAGVVNTLAGGGSLLTLPMLILFVGLPSTLANGTNRVGVWIQCLIAIASFEKRGVTRIRISLLLAIPAILGTIAGSMMAINLSDTVFNRLLAVIMLVMVAFIVWKPRMGVQNNIEWRGWRLWVIPLALFWVGVYGGLIQAGVGFFFIAVLSLLCGFDLVLTTYIKLFIIACYLAISLLIFAWHGEVNWLVGLTLALGNGLGGWIGSKIAVEKGEKAIRLVLLLSVIAMSLKLMGVLDFIQVTNFFD